MILGEATPAALTALRFVAGPLLFMGCTLFVVRWNKVNGKAGALGCAFTACCAGANAVAAGGLNGWWLVAAVEVATALHLAFNANPMLTSAMLLEKEKKRKAASS